MKFIRQDKTVARSRSINGHGASVGDISDVDQLKRVIVAMSKRIEELERLAVPEPTEFEVAVGASGSVAIEHGYNSQVRWYVTHWKASSGGPNLRTDEANTTLNTLVLISGAAGKAIIRVEPSQFEPTRGTA